MKNFIALKSCADRNGAQTPRQPCSELFLSVVYRLRIFHENFKISRPFQKKNFVHTYNIGICPSDKISGFQRDIFCNSRVALLWNACRIRKHVLDSYQDWWLCPTPLTDDGAPQLIQGDATGPLKIAVSFQA